MGTAYTWSFANSFLVFLLIVFAAQSLATLLRNYVPMPLFYGLFFAIGFAVGWLPPDMLLAANMVTVGTIAFNVLVIHSGTMINLPMIVAKWRESLTAILSALIMTAVCLLVLPPLIGRKLALLAPGAVIGGGASCAIGSRWVMDAHPEISFFPWMIFMFQGIFSVPVVSWALKKERDVLLKQMEGAPAPAAGSAGRPPVNPFAPFGPCAKIPKAYKTTAYYLGLIMVATVLNYALQGTLLKNAGINPNITALLIGLILGNLGLMDRAPLFQSDSYGLLILSLMGLMANNLAHTPWQLLVSFVVPVLVSLAVGGVVLFLCALLFAKVFHMSPYRAIILTMNSIMGFPVNQELMAQTIRSVPEQYRGAVAGQLTPVLNLGTSLISNGLSIFIVSILVALV